MEGDVEVTSTQSQLRACAYSCEAGSEKDDVTDHDVDQWHEHGQTNPHVLTLADNDREKDKEKEKEKDKEGYQGELTICEHFRGELIKCLNKVALQSQVSVCRVGNGLRSMIDKVLILMICMGECKLQYA